MHCARAAFLLLVNAPLLKTIGKNNKLGVPATNFEKLKLQTSNLRLKNPEQLQYSFIRFYTSAPRSFGLAPTAKNIMKVDSLCSHVAIVVALGTLSNHHSDGNENVEKQSALMSKTMTLHVRYTFWYISFPSSAKQQREMTSFKFFFFGRTGTHRVNFSSLTGLERHPCEFSSRTVRKHTE